MSWADVVFSGARGVGKTTAMAEAVKQLRDRGLDAILVCVDHRHAQDVAFNFGVNTISCLANTDVLRGKKDLVLIFDTDAVARIVSELELQIASLMETMQIQAKMIGALELELEDTEEQIYDARKLIAEKAKRGSKLCIKFLEKYK